jgi:hypothetical protein
VPRNTALIDRDRRRSLRKPKPGHHTAVACRLKIPGAKLFHCNRVGALGFLSLWVATVGGGPNNLPRALAGLLWRERPIGADLDATKGPAYTHLRDEHLAASRVYANAEAGEFGVPEEEFGRSWLFSIDQALGNGRHFADPYDENPESYRNQASGNKRQRTARNGNARQAKVLK